MSAINKIVHQFNSGIPATIAGVAVTQRTIAVRQTPTIRRSADWAIEVSHPVDDFGADLSNRILFDNGSRAYIARRGKGWALHRPTDDCPSAPVLLQEGAWVKAAL